MGDLWQISMDYDGFDQFESEFVGLNWDFRRSGWIDP